MKKNELFPAKKTFSLSRLTQRLLWLGYCLIALPLFYLTFEISNTQGFSFVTAAYFGEILEYIVAALALLTAGSYLVERVAREVHKDK